MQAACDGARLRAARLMRGVPRCSPCNDCTRAAVDRGAVSRKDYGGATARLPR